MSYEGSCHCGAVTFVVDAEMPIRAVSCNCTHCRRKGLLLAFLPGDQVTITSPARAMREYLFNSHTIQHQICTTCGVEPLAFGKTPNGDPICGVNLRTVISLDLDGLELDRVDGLKV